MNTVNVSREGAVTVVAINRPDKLNALDPECRRELRAALEAAGSDGAARVVVLTGEGRGFCVGHDLGAKDDPDIHAVVRDTYNPIPRAIVGMDKPVIAAINGPAVGAGMGFALMCDLRVMGDSAFFACAFGKVGLIPDSGTSCALVRAVGYARAFEMAASGRKVPAQEALSLGLVNRVVPADQVRENALRWAQDLARGPGLSLALTKRLLLAGGERDLRTMLDREAISQGAAARWPDFAEGAAAMLAKRPPQYSPEPVRVPGEVPPGCSG